jgi:hypothetical protein
MKGNIVTGSARINGKKVSVTYDVPLFDPPTDPPVREPAGKATHGRDFAWVNWFGVTHYFDGPQCSAVAHLWRASKEGVEPTDERQILEGADSDLPRLKELFKHHPAWGTMIVQPGFYKLSRQV